MRIGKIFLAITVGLVTQSCKIEMPSVIELVSNYAPLVFEYTSGYRAYDFSQSEALHVLGGFQDTLIIGDDPTTHHGDGMKKIVISYGAPETSIIFMFGFARYSGGSTVGLRELLSDSLSARREKSRVVCIPRLLPLKVPRDPGRIALLDKTLFVPVA